MKKKTVFGLLVLIFTLVLTVSYASGQESRVERPLYVPGEILVKLRPDVSLSKISDINRRYAMRTLNEFTFTRTFHLSLPASLSVDQAIQFLQRESIVEYVGPNNLYYLDQAPDDPGLGNLWGLHNTGQTGGTADADIDAPEAWDITTGDSNLVIAVIDSGLDLDHPDIAANLWTNPGEIANNGLDDDGNGYIDDVHGWDFATDDNDPSAPNDACVGHGTHTAGTIGAVGNNGVGVTGVNWHVKLMPLRAFKPLYGIFCSANDADLIEAIEYHTLMGVRISSNSWGGSTASQPTMDAIRASDSIFVAAAGNGNSAGIGQNNDVTPSYPANYPLDNIIAVAATDDNDALASFSNYGLTTVDLSAPGVDVASTLPDNTYGSLSGTSMATPHVAGVAGLLLAQDPTLTNNEVKWRILKGVDNIGLPVVTGGRLNAYGALAWGLTPMAVTTNATPVGSTFVRAGSSVQIHIDTTNQDTASQTVAAKVYARLSDGRELVLVSTTRILAAGETLSVNYTRQVPNSIPVGTTFRIFVQVQTSVSFDEDWIEYTVIP